MKVKEEYRNNGFVYNGRLLPVLKISYGKTDGAFKINANTLGSGNQIMNSVGRFVKYKKYYTETPKGGEEFNLDAFIDDLPISKGFNFDAKVLKMNSLKDVNNELYQNIKGKIKQQYFKDFKERKDEISISRSNKFDDLEIGKAVSNSNTHYKKYVDDIKSKAAELKEKKKAKVLRDALQFQSDIAMEEQARIGKEAEKQEQEKIKARKSLRGTRQNLKKTKEEVAEQQTEMEEQSEQLQEKSEQLQEKSEQIQTEESEMKNIQLEIDELREQKKQSIQEVKEALADVKKARKEGDIQEERVAEQEVIANQAKVSAENEEIKAKELTQKISQLTETEQETEKKRLEAERLTAQALTETFKADAE